MTQTLTLCHPCREIDYLHDIATPCLPTHVILLCTRFFRKQLKCRSSKLNWTTYGVFRRGWYCTQYARINCKQTKPVLVKEWMTALNPNKQHSVHWSRSLIFLLSLGMHALAWNSNTAVYSSLYILSAVQLFFGIFIYSVCLCLKWGLLTFRNFKGFPYV